MKEVLISGLFCVISLSGCNSEGNKNTLEIKQPKEVNYQASLLTELNSDIVNVSSKIPHGNTISKHNNLSLLSENIARKTLYTVDSLAAHLVKLAGDSGISVSNFDELASFVYSNHGTNNFELSLLNGQKLNLRLHNYTSDDNYSLVINGDSISINGIEEADIIEHRTYLGSVNLNSYDNDVFFSVKKVSDKLSYGLILNYETYLINKDVEKIKYSSIKKDKKSSVSLHFNDSIVMLESGGVNYHASYFQYINEITYFKEV